MVTKSGTPPTFASCPLINQSVCAMSQMGGSLVVILYNPTIHRRFERVTIPWPTPNVQVVDSTAALHPSQTTAVMPNLARGPGSAPYDVQFVAEVAGLGLNTYFLVSPSELQPISTPHRHQRAAADSTVMRSFVPSPNSPDVSIENAIWILNFDGTTGFLSSVTNRFTGVTVALSQSFFWYASYQGKGQDSGAYIFRPDVSNATALPVAKAAVNVTTVVGTLASEVRQMLTPWLTQIVRLTAELPEIEFEWTVGHIPVGDAQGKEIISRFSSNISSNATWYTDSNGREFVRRVRNFRPTWNWQPTEITAGNYYPCNAMAWLADESAGPGRHGMTVLTDRSQGCSSQQDGALEFMVHRRLLHDDGRGVGEPLNEPGTDGLGLTVTGLHYLLLAPPAELASAARQTAGRVFAPVQPMFATLSGSVSDYISSHLVTSSLLKTALPPSIELMTLQVSDASGQNVLLRLSHQYGVGESDIWSRSVTLDLSQLFTVAITSATELSLTGNQAAGAHKQLNWNTQTRNTPVTQVKGLNLNKQAGFNVTISPAQIRTFNVTFQEPLTWRL